MKKGFKKVVDEFGNIKYINELTGKEVSEEDATQVVKQVKSGIKKVVDENGNVKY